MVSRFIRELAVSVLPLGGFGNASLDIETTTPLAPPLQRPSTKHTVQCRHIPIVR